jgi:hypothetical protein
MVKWRAKLIKDEKKWQEIDQLLEYRLIESTQRVAIIHLDALPGFLENLLKTVESTEPHVAYLEGWDEWHQAGFTAWALCMWRPSMIDAEQSVRDGRRKKRSAAHLDRYTAGLGG